jgi:hypothetical protein
MNKRLIIQCIPKLKPFKQQCFSTLNCSRTSLTKIINKGLFIIRRPSSFEAYGKWLNYRVLLIALMINSHTRYPSAGSVGEGKPEATTQQNVAYWLLGVSGLIFGMVTVGGITRLTRSGLSMTDWKLQGSLPPLSVEQWQIEFERSHFSFA